MLFNNIDDGYLEGLLRGYRGGVLTSADYANLCQCESIDDMKMHLASTDYGNFLQNEPSPISTTTLAEKCTEKLVEEFNFLKNQAVEPLATFVKVKVERRLVQVGLARPVLGIRLADVPLHLAEGVQLLAEGRPLRRVGVHRLQAAPRDADAHRRQHDALDLEVAHHAHLPQGGAHSTRQRNGLLASRW